MRRVARAPLAAVLLACGGRGPDVIYLPSADDVVTRMLELARVDSGDVVYDLGCGDGRIVIAAARDRGARGVCVDIDASLVARSRDNADSAGVADRIEFRHADMFETDLRSATVVALYLSPALNVRLRPKLFREVRPGAWIVSHNFDMGDWKPDTVVRVRWPAGTTSTVQAWQLPADVAGTWAIAVSGDGAERRFRVRLVQQYHELSGTASESGRTMTLAAARLAGDSVELELSGRTGDHPDLLRLTGKVTRGEMRGVAWSAANTAGTRWRAVRP
ncbi:MAG TPA: class I SAM-dependent methyltransferase [Gemmatimonadales bacterium]|nr:class I SAM-dependent methyltransferase [Gemmatimonadales bacterium]